MVSKEIDDKIVNETKYLVELFLKTNESDKELSLKTGISSSTVGRRLSNKNYIMKAFPDDGIEIYREVMERRRKNLQNAKILGGQKSALNNMPIKDSDGKFSGSVPKLNLDAVYCENESSKLEFMLQLALTYRLQLPLLSRLFQINEKELLEKLLNISSSLTYDSLMYLFYHDNYDQELACHNAISFYKDLVNAVSKNDFEMQKILLNQINDVGMKDIIDKVHNNQELNDNDYLIVFKYQLKYGLPLSVITRMLGINKDVYLDVINEIVANNEELKNRYDTLMEYDNNIDRNRMV